MQQRIELKSVWYNHTTQTRYRVVKIWNDKGTQMYRIQSVLNDIDVTGDFIRERMVLDSIARDN